ncbi:Hypothetical protein PHPALM_11698 [Phytophthora palmivora]|uniref:Uncharacterized protein n=1 Tax=Phytophthora palmivora TaxID=4796 RepID=A0A2P4Y1L3_9STRA|nr:Hypothetical protein PHPALM_11698 [Phytophthora palmivora]
METPDNKSATTVSLFIPLLAPMIESPSHAALVEWKWRHKKYENEVAARCSHDPERIAKTTTSVVLCDLEWGLVKSDITDDLLMGKINSIISTVKNNTVPYVAAEFKVAVQMNLQESDVCERVVQFVRSSRQVIEERGWSEFFTDQEDLKLKCKLHPLYLKPYARQLVDALFKLRQD